MSEKKAIHPGIIFKRALDESIFSRIEVAKILGIHPDTLSSLCSGNIPLSYKMAERISKFFEIVNCFDDYSRDVGFWLNLNEIYYEEIFGENFKYNFPNLTKGRIHAMIYREKNENKA